MSALSPVGLLRGYVRPAVESMGPPYSDHQRSVEQLLIGTAAQESGGFLYLRQNSAGPALGLWEMEPDTFFDLWRRCPLPLKDILRREAGSLDPQPEEMAWNHRFGAMMARLKYRDDSLPLPVPGNVSGMAWAWKHGYNSAKGAGTVEQFVFSWRRYVAPYEKEMWP